MSKQQPERTCAGGGGTHPKPDLLRFVKGPENRILFDVSGKAPGRGAYVFPQKDFLEKALQKRGLSRLLGVQTPPELADEVMAALFQKTLQAISLAKKSGHLVLGAENVRAEAGRLKGLILAEDVSPASAEKLRNIPHTYRFATQADLEKITGVANCVVVGVLENGHLIPILKKYLALKA